MGEMLEDEPNVVADLAVMIAGKATRQKLNAAYRLLSFRGTADCYRLFAKIFTRSDIAVEPGEWVVDFAHRQIKLPLTPHRMWLDWDCALSVLGHETAIKRTYANLLKSYLRPQVFVDVGASYGTHSFLFLAHSVDTFSFEPNESCHTYFTDCCVQNGLQFHLINDALGSANGSATLYYPRHETWFGTLSEDTAKLLAARSSLQTQKVILSKLDSHVSFEKTRKVLIKIDAEGSEHAILLGAARTIERHRPLVIFESHEGTERGNLWSYFSEADYCISTLPWHPEFRRSALNADAFLQFRRLNFIAVPRDLQLASPQTSAVREMR